MSANKTAAGAPPALIDLARSAVERARKLGAQEAAAWVSRQRDVSLTWRDGKVEKIQEATTRAMSLKLYVDGRYSAISTSDLRPEAIDPFLVNAIAMTRALAADPLRTLPAPELYRGQASVDLLLADAAYDAFSATERRRIAEAIEQAARKAEGAAAILSVTTDMSDNRSESHYVTSNGFEGSRVETSFFGSAAVSVKDGDGRRPEDSDYGGGRRVGDVPDPQAIGAGAAKRALRRLGAKKGASAETTVVVENRAAGRLVSFLFGALSGQSLQQKRSFLDGKVGTAIGSPQFDITDDPLVVRGLGSRLWDGEGLAARKLPIVEGGVLRNFYIDTYYGKKLKQPPTTGRPSNLVWKTGDRSATQLVAGARDGILVTNFLGGNSNATTGDFSLGVAGLRIRDGALAEPVGEMNIAGNHLDLWKRLVAVGNDPFPYSALRTPTLVFEKVQVAGT